MKSKYSFQRKENYLNVNLSGEYDKGEFMSLPEIIRRKCHKENIFKALVNGLDLKNTNTPAMDRFFMGEEIARSIGSAIKLAIVWPQKDIDKFTENVAVNRGSYIIVVGNVTEAEKWLLETG